MHGLEIEGKINTREKTRKRQKRRKKTTVEGRGRR